MIKKGAIFIIVLLLITSCKSNKITKKHIANLPSKGVIRKHYKVEFNRQSLRANLSVKYKGKSDLPSLGASLRIIKDSIIWVNISKLGFPVAKMIITPDQVKFYEKISKSYFVGDFELISKSLGTEFNFEKIQNLFYGEAILPLKEKKYISSIEQNLYKLTPKVQNPKFDIFFWINPYTYKLEKEEIINSKNEEFLTILYKDFNKINESLFPKGFNIKASGKKGVTQIDVNYRNVEFDIPLRFPFKVPDGYKKISLNESNTR